MDLEANVEEAETTFSIEDMAKDLGGIEDDAHEDSDKEQPEGAEPGSEDVAKIKVGDKEFTAEQILEFEKGYMRQEDYTKKTQDVATARREIEDTIQRQTLNEFYGFNADKQPDKVQTDLEDIKDGSYVPTAEDLALMEPETRKVYQFAASVKAQSDDQKKILDSLQLQSEQRYMAEQYNERNSLMNGVYDKFVAGGMDTAAADVATADVFKTIRLEKLPYNQKTVQRVLDSNSTNTVDIEAIQRKAKEEAVAEYKAEKAKDATAGMAGASSSGSASNDITMDSFSDMSEDEQSRLMALELEGGD